VLCGKARGPGSSGKANCLECCQHAFFRVTDEEIEKHLKGLQVMGFIRFLPTKRLGFLPQISTMARGRKMSLRSVKRVVHTMFPSRSNDRGLVKALTLGSSSPNPSPPASRGIWGVS
jgi:hypothetical protein